MQSGTTGTRSRGFASMNAEKQREIARKGGRAAHEKGTAHEFTTDEARAAGRKGGERVSANREHMSRIGRLGGKMSAGRRQQGPGEPTTAGDVDGSMAEPGQAQRTDHASPDGNGAAQPGAMSQ
jgi:general stress protein YciG